MYLFLALLFLAGCSVMAARFLCAVQSYASGRAQVAAFVLTVVAGLAVWADGDIALAGTLGAFAALMAGTGAGLWLRSLSDDCEAGIGSGDGTAPTMAVSSAGLLAFLLIPLLGGDAPVVVLASVFFAAVTGAAMYNVLETPAAVQAVAG